ncbi:50S ribosomal protein L17 [Helicobacter baculiformis]|uniref:Large ribosomal subunit protein bL17 n=1 Tax=Helicobacter baculiformis TaxID=427351 RepID=A0ABV7ZIE7_9HELI|nr:50S ribosomal protein L17 [Helicobacter baculiformis]
MRHQNRFRKLGRTSAHRKALLKNLAISLIEHEKIETGVFKAKELQSYIERLVSVARKGDSNAHRYVFAYLQHKHATHKLVTELAPKYAERKGGYTRIHRSAIRKGDASVLASIAFV